MSMPEASASPFDKPSFELASRQASLAFERTLVSVDQSLMSAIRTSLSLIAFGFAMVLFFFQMSGETGVNLRVPARNFGLSLVGIGVGLLTIGLVDHHRRFSALRAQMEEMHQRRLLMEPCPRRRAPVAIIAMLLLISGILVVLGVAVRIGPFG